MKNFYREFFYISKHEKIRDKVMLTQVISTVAIIICCLIAMSITAYAHFSCNVSSNTNVIRAANFETDIQIQITDDDGNVISGSQIMPTTSNNKDYKVEGLEVGKWYKFTVIKSERNTVQTGFIIVSADGCPVTYHTQQLGVDKNVPGEYTEKITFMLMITDTTEVILESHWGTSSCYSDYKIDSVDDERYIILNEEIKMIVNEHTDPNVSEGNGEGTGETEPTVTEPTATESTDTTESTEPQPTEETTGAPTTEANE